MPKGEPERHCPRSCSKKKKATGEWDEADGDAGVRARRPGFNLRAIGASSLINALAVTQALTWGMAIQQVVLLLVPASAYGALGAVAAAVVTSIICVGIAAAASRCLRDPVTRAHGARPSLLFFWRGGAPGCTITTGARLRRHHGRPAASPRAPGCAVTTGARLRHHGRPAAPSPRAHSCVTTGARLRRRHGHPAVPSPATGADGFT